MSGPVESVLGFSVAECMADRDILLRQIHPEDQERVIAALAARVGSEETAGLDYRMRARDGHDVWVRDLSRTLHDETGIPRAWQRVIVDMTSQRLAETALTGAERRLEHLLAASPGVIFSLDPTTYRPTYVSESAGSVLGYPARDLLEQGDLWLERVHPDDRSSLREALVRVLQYGAHRHQYRLRQPGGEYRWLQRDLRLVRDAQGRPREIAGVCIDVTDQKQIEAERAAAVGSEKMRQLGLLASGTAHDLNQALALVVGHAELGLRHLEAGGTDPALLRELLQVILEAAGDGGETVGALLTFGREMPSGRVETVDLAALLRDAAQFTAPRWRDASQAEGRPIRLEVVAEPGLTVRARPGELREALTNLIFNAVDALPTGGMIHLRAARTEQHVVVEVVDTGVGMSPAVRERTFEPFFTTKGVHGTGLGLANVREIARRIGGEAAVESAPGAGTTVRLTLPSAVPAAAAVAPTESVERSSRALRVLVVDDEVRLARMVARVLDAAGYSAATAASGEEALDRLAEEPFDVLVTDLAMGDGMNGYGLAAAAHARWPALGIVLATGWGARVEPAEAERLGLHAVLSKPYRANELCRVVQGAAAGRASTDDRVPAEKA